MSASDSNPSIILGYLTFVRIPDHGIVGGYLLVNGRARPIEFHCTAPVRATRVQEILYGCTHQTALLCDQIGRALLNQATKCAEPASLILTDEQDAVGLRQLTDVPLALFVDEQEASRELTIFEQSTQIGTPVNRTSQFSQISDDDGAIRSRWSFEHSGHSLSNVSDFPDDRVLIREALLSVTGGWDLAEPFERIRAAIQEAQRAAA